MGTIRACFTSMARPARSGRLVNGPGNADPSAVSRWCGTMSAICSNQYSESPDSTRPLSGMAVGRTTSKAEMRSVATISR